MKNTTKKDNVIDITAVFVERRRLRSSLHVRHDLWLKSKKYATNAVVLPLAKPEGELCVK